MRSDLAHLLQQLENRRELLVPLLYLEQHRWLHLPTSWPWLPSICASWLLKHRAASAPGLGPAIARPLPAVELLPKQRFHRPCLRSPMRSDLAHLLQQLENRRQLLVPALYLEQHRWLHLPTSWMTPWLTSICASWLLKHRAASAAGLGPAISRPLPAVELSAQSGPGQQPLKSEYCFWR